MRLGIAMARAPLGYVLKGGTNRPNNSSPPSPDRQTFSPHLGGFLAHHPGIDTRRCSADPLRRGFFGKSSRNSASETVCVWRAWYRRFRQCASRAVIHRWSVRKTRGKVSVIVSISWLATSLAIPTRVVESTPDDRNAPTGTSPIK